MAGEQGTGKHKHKSAAEPFEHHEASSSKGEAKSSEKASGKSSSGGSSSSRSKAESSGEQGTGKHPHKSASDPKEHHEAVSKHK